MKKPSRAPAKKKSPWHFVALDRNDADGSYAAIMKMIAEADGTKTKRAKSPSKKKTR